MDNISTYIYVYDVLHTCMYVCTHIKIESANYLRRITHNMPFAQAGRRKLCNLTGSRTNDVMKSYSGPNSVAILSITDESPRLK